MTDARRLEEEVARLREELEDGNAAYQAVMKEACEGGITYETDDRLHCTCVPHLRQGIATLARLLDLARCGRADIAGSSDMTLQIARLKAQRLYDETKSP